MAPDLHSDDSATLKTLYKVWKPLHILKIYKLLYALE